MTTPTPDTPQTIRLLCVEDSPDDMELMGLALERADSTQALYQRYSDDAVAQGIFGSPILVINGERFWGQDRLMFVERTLARLTHAARQPQPAAP